MISLFQNLYNQTSYLADLSIEKEQQYHEIKKQFEEAEEYRKENTLFADNNQPTTHPQAIYTSRLLNSFTKDLSKYDSLVIDFTKYVFI